MGHTGHSEARSFPWSCSEDRVPSHYASGLPKTGVEIRRSQVVQGTRKEASEGYACKLEDWEGTSLDTQLFICKTLCMRLNTLLHDTLWPCVKNLSLYFLTNTQQHSVSVCCYPHLTWQVDYKHILI